MRSALARPIYDLPTDDCRHDFAGELPAVERRIVRLGARFSGFKGPAFLGIEDSDVRVAAARQRAASTQFHHPRRTCSKQFDNSRQWNSVLTMQARDG